MKPTQLKRVPPFSPLGYFGCRSFLRVIQGVAIPLLVAGCATTKITSHQAILTGPQPAPSHIWVYDFAASPADIPHGSGFADPRFAPAQPPGAEQVEAGRKAGAELATQLVDEIRSMGLPAEEASSRTQPQINDMVLRGYFLYIDKGSTTKRFVIGFGSGSAQLTTAVEGYRMTLQGLQKLESETVDSAGNKTPGEALGVVGLMATANPAGLIIGSGVKAAGEVSGSSRLEGRARATARVIAQQLKIRFQEMGWLQ